MIGAVVVTHGGLAESIIEVAQSIAGPMEALKAVSISRADNTDSIRTALSGAVKEVEKGSGVVVFTDMFGGTPTNIALSLLEGGKVEVITGVNLPMVLKFAGHRTDKKLHELVLYLKDYGQNSIVLAGDMLKEKK